MRKWLVLIRKNRHLTQAQVAKMADISRPYYTRIERGQHAVPVYTAMAIADALGFDWTKFYKAS